jgi:TusA-related sulfurtransferase
MPELKELDLTGMRCPMPIVELNRLVKELADGAELWVTADDPAFCLDVESWCRKTGHELLRVDAEGGRTLAVIRTCA